MDKELQLLKMMVKISKTKQLNHQVKVNYKALTDKLNIGEDHQAI